MTRTLKIVNGDVAVSAASGRLTSIEDLDKARQTVSRMLGLDAPNGAGINEVIGTVPDSEFALSTAVQRNIRGEFSRVVELQTRAQIGDRTLAERLISIASIFVVPAKFGSGSSKTGYALRVDALTASGVTISAGGLLNPPQGG
jgi:hypothetical protein